MSPGKTPPLARAATLTQIAEMAGVSRGAVSVVLNNSQSQVRVSAKTRQRILDAARQLNYHPNVVARSLMKRRTNIIGFYCAQSELLDPVYPFYAALLKGLFQGSQEHKKNFLTHGTFADGSEDAIFLELLNGQVDGLVLYTRSPSPLTERLVESHLPVVTVVNEVPGLPCATVDNDMGGRLLARHFASKGFRRVLYWVAEHTPPSSLPQRLGAFQEEAALHGVEVEVFHSLDSGPPEKDLERVLGRADRPQAIAAFNDLTAQGIVSWCASNGIRVPEEIAITGFDGLPNIFPPANRLTTVRAPWLEVARTAVSHLVKQCDGEAVPLRTFLPVEFQEGDTT